MSRRLTVLLILCSLQSATADEVSFSRDVKPILASCFRCHGPDEETVEAGLRLDGRERAIAKLESGERAIVPGKPDESELIARVSSTDEFTRMPPEGAGDPLEPEEIAVLRKWIAEGAEYERHWAWIPPERQTPPQVEGGENPIDAFVLDRLARAGLDANPAADRWVLARRVALDLTGLPPTPERAAAFVEDDRRDAYERYVDELLTSPAYGERWGRVWLDLARYADSAGYAQDPPRTIWLYRDWVIDALNANQPYNEFTRDQLAGDLLSTPTREQLIATGFHRNTMTNSEGGTNDEEFRNAAIVDRVNTTLQVWMGLTMGCAQCHTHKYDPITQEEYFQVFAILNNTEDADRGNEEPNLYVLSEADRARRATLERRIGELEATIEKKTKAVDPSNPTELPTGELLTRYVRVQQPGKGVFLHLAEVQVFVNGENVATRGTATQISTDFGGPAKFGNDGNTDGNFDAKSTFHTAKETDPWWEVDLGKAVPVEKIVLWNRTDGNVGSRLANFRVVALDADRTPVWARKVGPSPSPSVGFDLPKTAEKLSADERKAIAELGNPNDPAAEERKQLADAKKKLAGIKGTPTPILRELPNGKGRTTKIQIRGNFMVTGDVVGPGVLQEFHPLPDGVKSPNRLDLSNWIFASDNPLTGRVAANRLWEQLFGIGLVETSEDFGIQGEPPTHPRLLDWLATEYVRTGWDTKRMLRTIVTSDTYRRSSRATPELVERDPRNRLLTRGPSVRLSAETIRDAALAAGGLLSHAMHGPSVRPPRPNLGLKAAFGGSTDWAPSPGGDRYRRGLYTTWRRTTPYPSFMTFDATSREVCTIRRLRTNTPLQALVTLNDPVYVEAAQALGRRVLAEAGDSLDARMTYAFQLCVTRPPTDAERARLVELYEGVHAELSESPEDAKALATDPVGPAPDGVSEVDLATWTVVANVLMNLDEFLARK